MAAARPILPAPTEALVRAACGDFDKENSQVELALEELFSKYRSNGDPCHVLLKVVALNALYSTRIPVYSEKTPDVQDVTQHICKNAEYVDSALADGLPEVVDKISRVAAWGKSDRNYFSFAAKFCSWHERSTYPIYDSYSEACLWYYSRRDGFATFPREEYDYTEYVRRVRAFRDFPLYGLGSLSFKEIDKFLYLCGRKLSSVGAKNAKQG